MGSMREKDNHMHIIPYLGDPDLSQKSQLHAYISTIRVVCPIISVHYIISVLDDTGSDHLMIWPSSLRAHGHKVLRSEKCRYRISLSAGPPTTVILVPPTLSFEPLQRECLFSYDT